jgi:hypothetical protein
VLDKSALYTGRPVSVLTDNRYFTASIVCHQEGNVKLNNRRILFTFKIKTNEGRVQPGIDLLHLRFLALWIIVGAIVYHAPWHLTFNQQKEGDG